MTIRQVVAGADGRKARSCPRSRHAGAADFADRVVAWDAEYGRDLRQVWRVTSSSLATVRAVSLRRSRWSRISLRLLKRSVAVAASRAAPPGTGEFLAPQYLRFVVDDKPGIVSGIAGALAKVGANIDSLLQRPGYPKHRLPFVVTTEALPDFDHRQSGLRRSRRWIACWKGRSACRY